MIGSFVTTMSSVKMQETKTTARKNIWIEGFSRGTTGSSAEAPTWKSAPRMANSSPWEPSGVVDHLQSNNDHDEGLSLMASGAMEQSNVHWEMTKRNVSLSLLFAFSWVRLSSSSSSSWSSSPFYIYLQHLYCLAACFFWLIAVITLWSRCSQFPFLDASLEREGLR